MPTVAIKKTSLISPLGDGAGVNQQVLSSQQSGVKFVRDVCTREDFDHKYHNQLVAVVEQSLRKTVFEQDYRKQAKFFDPAVLAAMYVSQQVAPAEGVQNCGVVCGSSRGATHSWEEALADYVVAKRLKPYVSPKTTPGSFAASIADHLGCCGSTSFVSSTCTTGLQVIGSALGAMSLGVYEDCIASASEFSVTPFTLEQMMSIKVYHSAEKSGEAYQPFHPQRSGMVLGEGAASLSLTTKPTAGSLEIVGFGAAREPTSLTGMGVEGQSLVQAVQAALRQASMDVADIDLVVGHGSGTSLGDQSEMNAYRTLFAQTRPAFTSYKWAWGHALGAAGLMSLVMAVDSLENERFAPLPYEIDTCFAAQPTRYRAALVTALGFGGQAAAVIIKKPS